MDSANKNTPVGPCVEWHKCRDKDGYGVTYFQKRKCGAHRAAWIRAHGDIPAGMWVLHKCDNPPCVNVEHLFLGTPTDNVRDMVSKGRHQHGPMSAARLARMLRGEKVRTSKLTATQIIEIRARYARGDRQVAIAADFGVTQANISVIVRREGWTHVQDGSGANASL